MTGIRIKPIHGYECEYASIGNPHRCAKEAWRWETEHGDQLFYLCEEHGEAIISLFKHYAGGHSVTITGGYDDGPKSKLEELRAKIGPIEASPITAVIWGLIDYLEEKENEA